MHRKNRWKKYLIVKIDWSNNIYKIFRKTHTRNVEKSYILRMKLFPRSSRRSHPPLSPQKLISLTRLTSPPRFPPPLPLLRVLCHAVNCTFPNWEFNGDARARGRPSWILWSRLSFYPAPTLAVGAAFCLGDHAQRPSATTKVFHGKALRHW